LTFQTLKPGYGPECGYNKCPKAAADPKRFTGSSPIL